MRFLGIGDSCDLGAVYLALQRDGHDVRVFIADPMCHGTLAGFVARTEDWRKELDWIRDAGEEAIIIFENVGEERGELQGELRRDSFRVIGGSAFGDRLENDRGHAQQFLASAGLKVGQVHEFNDADAALRFIDEQPARYVLKFNGQGFSSSDNYVGGRSDGADVRAVLAAKMRKRAGCSTTFILMRYVEGVEMGVGAWFNGRRFLRPACLDWEHKRFFAGDMGELTGEMGTVVTFERSQAFFERTLLPLEQSLRAHGHCGWVNLNTIVNEDGVWPLEFTCRFGYPGYAILSVLQATPWAALFSATTNPATESFEARSGFSTGIVLTTPPFPYTRKDIAEPVGLPVLIDAADDLELQRHIHFGEVGLESGRLVTSGMYGWTMVVTGVGDSVAASRNAAYANVRRVFVPNMRYRLDIGEKLVRGDMARLQRLGLFG